jgi:hypothetical protein
MNLQMKRWRPARIFYLYHHLHRNAVTKRPLNSHLVYSDPRSVSSFKLPSHGTPLQTGIDRVCDGRSSYDASSDSSDYWSGPPQHTAKIGAARWWWAGFMFVGACCLASFAVCAFIIASYAKRWRLWLMSGCVGLVTTLLLVYHAINFVVCGAWSCVVSV